MAEKQCGNPKVNDSSSKSTNPSSPPGNDLAEKSRNKIPETTTPAAKHTKTPTASGPPLQPAKQNKDDDRNPVTLYTKAIKDAIVALRKVEVASKTLVKDHDDFIRQLNGDTGKVQGTENHGMHLRRADPVTELQVSFHKANDMNLFWSQIKGARWELVIAQVKNAIRVHGFFKAMLFLTKLCWSLGAAVRGRWIAAAAMKMLTILGLWSMVLCVVNDMARLFPWAILTVITERFVPITGWIVDCTFLGFLALSGAWVLNAGFALWS